VTLPTTHLEPHRSPARDALQWELAVLVEITWGFIIVDTDGIGAASIPIVWRRWAS